MSAASEAANLRLLIGVIPNIIIEYVEEEGNDKIVKLRLAMLPFSLMGGTGRAETKKDAISLALRSLVDRLCELNLFSPEIVKLAVEYGKEAIDLFSTDINRIFTHLKEVIVANKKISAFVRISKNFDENEFKYEHDLVTEEMRAVSDFWSTQTLRLPLYMRHFLGETADLAPLVKCEATDRPLGPAAVAEEVVPVEPIPSHQQDPADPSVQRIVDDMECEQVDVKPIQVISKKRRRADRAEPADSKPLAADAASVEPVEGVPAEAGDTDMDEAGSSGARAASPVQWDEEEMAAMCKGEPGERGSRPENNPEQVRRLKLQLIANAWRQTLEEDEKQILRFSGVDPAFLHVDKTKSPHPYKDLVDKIVEWGLIPNAECISNKLARAHIATLFSIISPLIHRYSKGDPLKQEWKRAEIRDVGRRFWLQPRQYELVNWQSLPPISGCSKEQACRRLLQLICTHVRSQQPLLLERKDDKARLSFLLLPVELVACTTYHHTTRMFESFVRGLCEIRVLPQWPLLNYLLERGETEQDFWIRSISHVVIESIFPTFIADYINPDPAAVKWPFCAEYYYRSYGKTHALLEQRRALKDHLGKKWTVTSVSVSVNSKMLWPDVAGKISLEIKGNKSPLFLPGRSPGYSPRDPRVDRSPRCSVDECEMPSTSAEPVPPRRFHVPERCGEPSICCDEGQDEETAHHRACLQSFCRVLDRRTVEDGDMIRVSGIHHNVAHGIDRGGYSKYKNILTRFSRLHIIPNRMHFKIIEEGRPFEDQLRALFVLIDDLVMTHVKGNIPLIGRIAWAFWEMQRVPRSLEIVRAGPDTPTRDTLGSSAYAERVLPLLAERLGTVLVKATDMFGNTLMWFRSISHIILGVQSSSYGCPFEYFLRRILERCGKEPTVPIYVVLTEIKELTDDLFVDKLVPYLKDMVDLEVEDYDAKLEKGSKRAPRRVEETRAKKKRVGKKVVGRLKGKVNKK